MNWNTSASSEHHHSCQLERGRPSSSFTAMVNEIGAHSDSGQHHTVRPRTSSMTGAFTPHSMLPVMRKGTSVFPMRKRMFARVSKGRAASRSSIDENSSSKLCLPFSAGRKACFGRSAAIARYASSASFFT